MASRTSLVFAKGAVALIGGGFIGLTWQDVANAAYAAVKGVIGQTDSNSLFTPWGPIGMIAAGVFFAWAAIKTR